MVASGGLPGQLCEQALRLCSAHSDVLHRYCVRKHMFWFGRLEHAASYVCQPGNALAKLLVTGVSVHVSDGIRRSASDGATSVHVGLILSHQ